MARDFGNELNYEEAVREAFRAYTPKLIPPELSEIMEGLSEQRLSSPSARNFE